MVTSYFFAQALLWFSAIAPANALDSKGLIEQALDEPTKITLEKVKLVDAIQAVGEQTGIRILMTPDVMELVPLGGDTLIEKVDITGISLRQGLVNLFGPLGMTFVVAEDHVRIIPREPLLCLGRAPTWTELDLLAQLTAMQPGTDNVALEKLKPLIQFQGGPQLAWGTLRAAIENVGAGTGDEVLTIACANLNWAWCFSGERLVVTPVEFQIQRQLQQPISVRLNNRPLDDVLAAIGEQTGVQVRAEPGALATLPPPMQQSFSFNASQLPAERALEKIANHTGLGYMIGTEGVVFYQPAMRDGQPRLTSAPAPSGNADPYVAKVSIEIEQGKTFEWLIRASELPPDLKELRERELQSLFETARRKNAHQTP